MSIDTRDRVEAVLGALESGEMNIQSKKKSISNEHDV
jgi:hypothetical protein